MCLSPPWKGLFNRPVVYLRINDIHKSFKGKSVCPESAVISENAKFWEAADTLKLAAGKMGRALWEFRVNESLVIKIQPEAIRDGMVSRSQE